jgi:hypothetical protein
MILILMSSRSNGSYLRHGPAEHSQLGLLPLQICFPSGMSASSCKEIRQDCVGGQAFCPAVRREPADALLGRFPPHRLELAQRQKKPCAAHLTLLISSVSAPGLLAWSISSSRWRLG